MLFIVLIYLSNLRTILTRPEFQPEINSHSDVIDQGIQTVYTIYPKMFIAGSYRIYDGEQDEEIKSRASCYLENLECMILKQTTFPLHLWYTLVVHMPLSLRII